jgi:hypothetical protein
LHRHHRYALAVALFQVGIVLASVSLLVRVKGLYLLSLVAGVAGVVCLVLEFSARVRDVLIRTVSHAYPRGDDLSGGLARSPRENRPSLRNVRAASVFFGFDNRTIINRTGNSLGQSNNNKFNTAFVPLPRAYETGFSGFAPNSLVLWNRRAPLRPVRKSTDPLSVLVYSSSFPPVSAADFDRSPAPA